MKRPKVKLKLDNWDILMEIIGAIAILISIGVPIYYYNQLPETIPIHYGLNGKPDGYGSKVNIFFLAGIGVVIYIGLKLLTRVPHIMNFPISITESNAEKQYRIITKMLRSLSMVIALLFLSILIETIFLAMEKHFVSGLYFLPVGIVALFGIVGHGIYKSFKNT